MYGVTNDNRMSYNEAQRNLKNLDQYGVLDAFDDPDDIARAQQLWADSTANVADKLYGKTGVTLRQDGNWYQNAENGASYYGQQGIGNTPDGWNNFTDNVYSIGRVDGPAVNIERGMYGVTDANRMSYNEAQSNLKNIDQYGLLDAYHDPDDIARAQQLWADSTANVADKLYGKTGVTLRQDGNWYQNAENGASYYGQQGIGNTPDGWDNFTDNVYTIGRLNSNNSGLPISNVPTPVAPTPVVPTPVVPTPVVPTPVVPTPVAPTPTSVINDPGKSGIIGALIAQYINEKNS